ncbi:MAG: hypothetical protein DRQ60_10030 [Gammaproteobacteria bacterium]|nr:MAG: hypothetical protein DRQ60_10030 [Gammaproteobacteria bacterium]
MRTSIGRVPIDRRRSRGRLGNKMQQNPVLKQGIETSNARASESPPSQGRTGARDDPPIQFGEQ